MIYTLTIRDDSGLLFEVGFRDETCLVPTDGTERAVCMKALSDALGLLADTNVTQNIPAKEAVLDAGSQQSLQHPCDFRVAYYSAPPSEQQAVPEKSRLQLVSVD